MSCWVAPIVAAEYWGITVSEVLERVRKGTIPSKTEFGFTLVDVAPQSPRAATGFRIPAAKPPTHTVLTDELTAEEIQALTESSSAGGIKGQEEAAAWDQDGPFDWRPAREATSRLRRPPRVSRAAA